MKLIILLLFSSVVLLNTFADIIDCFEILSESKRPRSRGKLEFITLYPWLGSVDERAARRMTKIQKLEIVTSSLYNDFGDLRR